MKETQALIERVRRINETHQQLHVTVDPSLSDIKPGQSVLARIGDDWNPYLREQWWPVRQDEKKRLVFERPVIQRYEPGTVVSLIGAVGQPFRFRRTLRNVLLLAYNSDPTPLLLTIPSLLANGVSVTLILLGTDYATQHLPPEVEIIQGTVGEGEPPEKLDWANRVTTIGWADQVFVTVPQEDEMTCFREIWGLFSALRADIPASYLFGIFRPLLPCGIGACSACMVRLSGNGTALICKDGPAIDLTKVPLS